MEKEHYIEGKVIVLGKEYQYKISEERLKKARAEVMERHEREPIERLIVYGFSPTEIEYLEKKVWGITKNFVLATQLFENLEKALGVSKNSGDLEKAYFKIKLKEMTRVGTGLSLDHAGYNDYISRVQPLDATIVSKLEFYDFSFQDFVKIKPGLLPDLSKIIADVEKIYGVPEKLSGEVKEQVKDHLMQELGIV